MMAEQGTVAPFDLFRGISVETGEWVYGSLVRVGIICSIFEHSRRVKAEYFPLEVGEGALGMLNGILTPVKQESVGQYAGFTTSSVSDMGLGGELLFEGDLVRTGEQGSLLFRIQRGIFSNCRGNKKGGFPGFGFVPVNEAAITAVEQGVRTDPLYWKDAYGLELVKEREGG